MTTPLLDRSHRAHGTHNRPQDWRAALTAALLQLLVLFLQQVRVSDAKVASLKAVLEGVTGPMRPTGQPTSGTENGLLLYNV